MIPHEGKKNTQQVSLGYGLFSKMANIKIEVVSVVHNSSKAKQKKHVTDEKQKSSTKNILLKGEILSQNKNDKI